jgi:predicted permease
MAGLRRFLLRCYTFLRPAAAEREMRREIAAHLRFLEEDYARLGMSTTEARRAARLAFGGVDQVKERSRDARGFAALSDLSRDTRHALRRLGHDWRFTAAAVLILALGIGANTAIFSVVNAVLIRPPSFQNTEQLVNIYQNTGESRLPSGNSYPAYLDMVGYTDVFADVAAFTFSPVSYEVDELLQSGFVEYATSSYLPVLGLAPAAGRWFRPDEDGPGGGAAAVIGYQTWTTRFGASPSLVGQTIRIDGTPVTVIGVAPEGHNSGLTTGIVTDFWLSISTLPLVPGALPSDPLVRNLAEPMFMVKARLQPGVGLPRAQAAMTTLGTRLAAEFPAADPGRGITVLASDDVRVHPQLDGLLVPTASLLLIVVALVLAIACSNLATLVLIRASSRAKEVAVRLALGATRGQLVRHLLTENVVLSLAGGGLGYVVAGWAIRIVVLADLPLVVDLSLDYRVLGFTLLLSIVTGLAFGLAPALRATRIDLVPELRAAGGTLSLNRRWFSLSNALVVSQVAASCLLLVSASLVLQTLASAEATDLGFRLDGLAFLETDVRYSARSAENSSAFYETLRDRMEALPGVEAATLATGPPVGGSLPTRKEVAIAGYTPADGEVADSRWGWAGPGYFETLRIPILHGRSFTAFDHRETPPVVVINETMARRYFGTPNAVGRRLRFADRPRQDPATGTDAEVIGVVPDTRRSLTEESWPQFYRSFSQGPMSMSTSTVIVRTAVDPTSLLQPMQRVLRDLDVGLPGTATTLTQHVSDSLAAGRTAGGLLAALGGLGLSLASLGLYAVVAFGVSRRTLEIGIRMSLGARSAHVTWTMARDVAQLLAVGVGLGLGLSWLGIRALGVGAVMLSEAPNVSVASPSADAGTFASVALVMVLVGLLATVFPARRAVRHDPLAALRHL